MILTVTANPAVDTAYFVDSFNMGEVHRPVKTVLTAGGKGLNVSRVASILGASVTAMGFVGGANGEFIKSEVKKLNIRSLFTDIEGETRRNIDIIDSFGRTGEILEQGPTVSAQERACFLEQYSKEVKNHEIICISGSLPRGLDSSFYCELIAIAKACGKRVIADTSGKTLENIIDAKPYMIKPNEDELSKLFDKELDIKDTLKELYLKGVDVPFVTLGGDGAFAYDGSVFYRFSIPRIDIKNTVGSGDSTVGGIAVGLCRGLSIIDAIRLGMASGMANTQFEQTGMVSAELVEKFYKEVKVTLV